MFVERYRPYYLKDIFGQNRQKNQVGAWLRSGDVPRSILLQGPYSGGKTTMARILARSLLCKEPVDGEACGECTSCKHFDRQNHLGYTEVNAGNDRGIDAMRRIAKQAHQRPAGSKRRVILLDEAHSITKAGWEAVLKPLEEPPAHVVFIIVTTNPEKIPETIRSRCSTIKMSAITVEECSDLLAMVAEDAGLGKMGITKDHLRMLAQATGGRPRNALHGLDQIYALVKAADASAVNDTLVNSYIKEVVESDVEFTAAKLLKDVLGGQPSRVMKRLSSFTEVDDLVSTLRLMSNQALQYIWKPELLDPYYRDIVSDIQILTMKGKEPKERVLKVTKLISQLEFDCMANSVSGDVMVMPVLVEATTICREYLQQQKKKAKEEAQAAA